MSENLSTADREHVLTYELNDDERPSEGVVSAVAAAADTDPAALDPLAASIDSDSLDALFADRYDGTARPGGRVEFSYLGYELLVTGDGLVSVFDSE